MYTCRECENEINQATEICPRCGADLTLPVPGDTTEKKKLSTLQILLRWGILLSILMAAIWTFVWYVASPKTGGTELQAEAQAVQSLDDVRALLSSYAEAQGGGYPKTLDPLGPLARQAAQAAQSEGYSLDYTPGPADANGTIRAYSLESRPSNFGYRSFYTDGSNLVRATGENRSATSSDPPIQ